jgi:hypothetical protein
MYSSSWVDLRRLVFSLLEEIVGLAASADLIDDPA